MVACSAGSYTSTFLSEHFFSINLKCYLKLKFLGIFTEQNCSLTCNKNYEKVIKFKKSLIFTYLINIHISCRNSASICKLRIDFESFTLDTQYMFTTSATDIQAEGNGFAVSAST